jgi:hypothetical protein
MNWLMSWAIPLVMIIIGLGMAGIWAVDIASGKFSGQGHFFRWREGENLLWPHILAEYLVAVGLISGGFGLILLKQWALPLSFISLGGLIYSAINSSGWVLAKKERLLYGIPIWISLAFGIIAMLLLAFRPF